MNRFGDRVVIPDTNVHSKSRKPMTLNPSASIPDPVRKFIHENLTKDIANKLRGVIPVPAWGTPRMVKHFIPEHQREALDRVAALCPDKVPTYQYIAHLIDTDCSHYKVRVNFTLKNGSTFIPDKCDLLPGMEESDPYLKIREYALNYYEADRRAAHFKALSLYLAHACTSMNQLKHIWPDFDKAFDGYDEFHRPKPVNGWLKRFKDNPGGRSPELFPGFQEHVLEAQTTVAMYLMSEKAEEVRNGNVAFNRTNSAADEKGPRVPWFDDLPRWLKDLVPTRYEWSL